MRAVVQRVSEASVRIEGEIVGKIGRGFLILLGVTQGDTPELCSKENCIYRRRRYGQSHY